MIVLIGSFLFLMILAVSFTGWGSLTLPHPESWAGKFGAGVLLVYFLVSAAGWTGYLLPSLLWIILAIGAFLWVRPGHFAVPVSGLMIALCGLILFPLIILPPVSRDAMIHHLYEARIWLEAGRIVRPGWAGVFSYPYLVESLYTIAGGTFGFRFARVISLLGFLAAASVPAGYFLGKGNKKAAVLSLILLMSIPELVRNATWSYSDSFLVFFSLLAYVELVKKDGNPVLAVLWAGGAGSCKYNGVIVLFSVIILLPFFFRSMSRKVILYSILAVFFTTVWWAVPNILKWSNPVYPLLQSIFGPNIQMSGRAAGYFAVNTFGSSISGILDYLLLPVRISLDGEWNNPVLFDGASGPLLLAGTILALPVVKNRRRKFLLPLIYMIVALISNGTSVRVRYFLPGLAMLSIPIAEAFNSLLQNPKKLIRASIFILITVCAVWSADKIRWLYGYEKPWEFRDDTTYLHENAPYYDFYRKCERYLSESDTTLMVNMNRPFYFPGYAVFDNNVAPLQLMEILWSGTDAEGITAALRENGITHLAMDMFITSINITPELSADELTQWRYFVSFKLDPLLTIDRYILFKLE